MTHPTEDEIRAFQAGRDAKLDAEFAASPPAGSEGFTRRQWSSLTFGDQAHYRRGKSDPKYQPSPLALRAMTEAISDTPSPSIMSGYGVWAFDILESLHRRGWTLVRN
jgi:hypothetical protein